MSKICPRCGNLNTTDTRFCTACGTPFVPTTDQPGPSGVTMPVSAPGGSQRDPKHLMRILIGAGIGVAVIIAILFLLTKPGIPGIPAPSPLTPAVTVATPVVPSYVVVQTPSAEPTTVRTETPPVTTTVPDTVPPGPTLIQSPVCPSDRRACGASCTDVMTDSSNCGGCGISCSSTQVCQQGHCTVRCAAGETICFDGCHDLLFDADNCGTCGNACPVGLACNNSVCTPPLKTPIPTYWE